MMELNTRETKENWFAVNKMQFIGKELNLPFQRLDFAEDGTVLKT